jgi:tetratricopeptide (TPR) repeat protein
MHHRVSILSLAALLLCCLVIPANLVAQDAAEYLNRAKAAVEMGNYDKAVADCDKALVIDPKSAEAFNVRGHAWACQSKFDRAIVDFDQALAINPKFAEAYNNRGGSWLDKGDYDKAIADCNQALSLNPKLAGAYFVRGLVWSRKREDDKATADYSRALAITPDDWNMLNNLGVSLWIQAMKQESKAAQAEAAGDLETAKTCRQKSVALKDDAKAQWNAGVFANPAATDIHSNLGYAYYEANDLDSAERHLREAVKLLPLSPLRHNNLGRVLMRKSQQYEAEAREAEAKGKADPAQAAKAKQLKDEAKAELDAAIAEFQKAVDFDPTLLEARLNLGEVYLSLNDLDKAEAQFAAIIKLSFTVKDAETSAKFSQAYLGSARVALARKNPDEAVKHLQKALELNPQNASALNMLAVQRFERGEYHEGEKSLWPLLAAQPAQPRRSVAEQFAQQFESAGQKAEAVRAWNFMAWAFATSPKPGMLDPDEALKLAQHVVEMTNQQDALSLDTLAAAQAASGKYDEAAKSAQAAIDLAKSQGNKPLADAIAGRLQSYQQGKPYRSDPDGGDRP